VSFLRPHLFASAEPYIWAEIAFVFFFLYETAVIWIIESKRKILSPRQSINLFLGLKVGKIILSLVFATIYAIVVKIELKRFILVFVAFYLAYLLFDTVYLANGEKKVKSDK
jgi:hypothetical protein